LVRVRWRREYVMKAKSAKACENRHGKDLLRGHPKPTRHKSIEQKGGRKEREKRGADHDRKRHHYGKAEEFNQKGKPQYARGPKAPINREQRIRV